MEPLLQQLVAQTEAAVAAQRRPGATYRLQFHSGFTFRDAASLTPYFHSLGITDCYASPYLKARTGSTHGYDITDHRQFNPEVGTEEDYTNWTRTLNEHGMGQVLDIVPNHMAVACNDNAWWNDVLENGPASPYSDFFDIEWQSASRPELQGRLLVPILGESYGKTLEAGLLQLKYAAGVFTLHYFEHRIPIAPRSYGLILGQRLDELERLTGPEAAEFIEYQSIFTAVKNLPLRTETDPARLAERRREKEVIKRRLAALTEEHPRLAAFIDETVARFNGKPGEPQSFDLLEGVLDDQVYRLAYWRVAADEINYRRFFDINDLAAVGMEREDVFTATHELILRLLAQGDITGLRIDHIDGLYDPVGYLRRLQTEYVMGLARQIFTTRPEYAGQEWAPIAGEFRQRLAAFAGAAESASGAEQTSALHPDKRPLYVVVEKILIGDEKLPAEWPTFGTSGYDFLNVVNSLFVDGANGQAFTSFYRGWINDDTTFEEVAYQKRILILQIALSSELQMISLQLDRLAQRNRWSRDFTRQSLRRALREVIACFPVYRSYVAAGEPQESDRRNILRAIRRAMFKNAALSNAHFHFIRDTLLLRQDAPTDDYKAAQQRFAGKFQQVTAPVFAKGVEDTAFYVYNRLLSLNEVGGNPDRFGRPPAELHEAFQERQTRWPWAMSATSTHDTKRSEDVRARINVLSEMPDAWAKRVARWSELNAPLRASVDEIVAPAVNEEYLLYQTLVGAWPFKPTSAVDYRQFVERVQDYMRKALHEAKVHTSWINPNQPYDSAVREFIGKILTPETGSPFLDDFRPFQREISRLGMINSLAQTLLKISVPGVPDIYQGQELWDFSLVDPDNRRPVDYQLRQRLLRDLRERAGAPESDRRPLMEDLWAKREDGRIKLYLTWKALECRRDSGELFTTGAYLPIEPHGGRAHHVFSFLRSAGDRRALVAVPRLVTQVANSTGSSLWKPEVWTDTLLPLPPLPRGLRWRNVFTGETVAGRSREGQSMLRVGDLFAQFPVALLVATE